MSSYLVPFFFRFTRSFCLPLSRSLFSFLLWAACLVELEDGEEGELQEAERESDRARRKENLPPFFLPPDPFSLSLYLLIFSLKVVRECSATCPHKQTFISFQKICRRREGMRQRQAWREA